MLPRLACNSGFEQVSLPWLLKYWLLNRSAQQESISVSQGRLWPLSSEGHKKTDASIPVFEMSSLASSSLTYPANLFTDL